MIRSFQGIHPTIAASAYVDESAVVIGDVTIGEQSSIWPLAVIRGDVNRIRIGARTSIQDGSVVHATHDGPYSPGGAATTVEDDVTVGHKVILHACTVKDRVLVGMGAIIMDDAVVESDVIIGAGSLVPPGKVLESGYLYLGSPVRQVRPLTEQERERLVYSAAYYVKLADRYRCG
ncbi:MAG: gamma carbonic anhydrase family protein [Xanthomonadaceae bacterium]|nr:gamma carbonic anhydrase family protein [Xanthomonadaceae bacterium]